MKVDIFATGADHCITKDTWAFPGGAVDEDETPEIAIIREFEEEVNLKVRIVPIGDEPVWGQTDDYLDEPWRLIHSRADLS